LVDKFYRAPQFRRKIRERTQADYRKWLDRFQREFGADEIQMFEEYESLAEFNNWRDQWAHSPKQFDYCAVVVCRFLNWCKKTGRLKNHHLSSIEKTYSADRADIVWTDTDIASFVENAPEYATRILIFACETGLRPADLAKANVGQIEPTPNGRRLRVRTSKSNRPADIPVTAKLATVLDATPSDRHFILLGDNEQPLTAASASKAIKRWRNRIKPLAPEVKGYDLRLYDARGTAATRLLRANVGLNDIAAHMGWSLRFAQSVIEHYAEVSGEETDRAGEQIQRYQDAENAKTVNATVNAPGGAKRGDS
jgi:integrase